MACHPCRYAGRRLDDGSGRAMLVRLIMKTLNRSHVVPRSICRLLRVLSRHESGGQPNWRSRKPDGRLPAPPHDETGHTWHHPDAILFSITRDGTAAHAPAGYLTDMPGFGDVLIGRRDLVCPGIHQVPLAETHYGPQAAEHRNQEKVK